MDHEQHHDPPTDPAEAAEPPATVPPDGGPAADAEGTAEDARPDEDRPAPAEDGPGGRGLKKSDLLIALAVIVVLVLGGLVVTALTDEGEGGGDDGGSDEQVGRPTDDFNRVHDPTAVGVAANGDAWDAVAGVWGIDAAQVYLAVPQLDGSANLLLLDMGSADGRVSTVFARSRLGAGLVFRYTSPEDYYVLLPAGGFGTWVVQHVVDGEAASNEGVGLAPSADGTTVELELDGDSVTVRVADDEPATIQLDGDGAGATRVGFVVQGYRADEARWDDFYAVPQ